jgi:hypothetical protein
MKIYFQIIPLLLFFSGNSFGARNGAVTSNGTCHIWNFREVDGLIVYSYYQACGTVTPNGTSRCLADGRCSVTRAGLPEQTGNTINGSPAPTAPKSN